MNHLYKIGERVQHLENNITGSITGLFLSQEVDEDMEPDERWYEIRWDGRQGTGCEHEQSITIIV